MNVIIIGAHPDDESIGAGATISKHIEKGDNVFIVLFSVGHIPIQPDLKKQAYDALKVYGIKDENLFWLDCKSGEFDKDSKIEINNKLTNIVSKIKPKIVYTHFYGETHQDHRFVFDSTMVACRPSHHARGTDFTKDWNGVEKILCYEIVSSTNWSGRLDENFNPTEFNVVSKNDVDKKINAYKCYKDEIRPENHPRSMDGLITLAKHHGNSIGVKYAEAFVVIRNIKYD